MQRVFEVERFPDYPAGANAPARSTGPQRFGVGPVVDLFPPDRLAYNQPS